MERLKRSAEWAHAVLLKKKAYDRRYTVEHYKTERGHSASRTVEAKRWLHPGLEWVLLLRLAKMGENWGGKPQEVTLREGQEGELLLTVGKREAVVDAVFLQGDCREVCKLTRALLLQHEQALAVEALEASRTDLKKLQEAFKKAEAEFRAQEAAAQGELLELETREARVSGHAEGKFEQWGYSKKLLKTAEGRKK